MIDDGKNNNNNNNNMIAFRFGNEKNKIARGTELGTAYQAAALYIALKNNLKNVRIPYT